MKMAAKEKLTEKYTKDWKIELAKFKIPQARLLYIIFYLYKTNEINFVQKYRLKELIVLEDEILSKSFQNFEKLLNITKFTNELKIIYEKNKGEAPPEELKPSNDLELKPKKSIIDIKGLFINIKKKEMKPNLNIVQPVIEVEEVLFCFNKLNKIKKLGSPVSTEMLNTKKKRQQLEKINREKKENEEKIKKGQEENDDIGIKECDIGNSPTIIPTKYGALSFLGKACKELK